MIDEPVKLNEVIEAFKALGGSAKSKQIEDYIISSRGNILPKAYQYGGWDSYRKTINQVIQVYCPGYKKYRNEDSPPQRQRGIVRNIFTINPQTPSKGGSRNPHSRDCGVLKTLINNILKRQMIVYSSLSASMN